MKKFFRINNVVMSLVMFIVCASFMSVMFMQFRTVEETDITDIENMREAELRKTLSEWKTKYEEVATQLEETNKRIEEYNHQIEKSGEASGLIDEDLRKSNIIVGKTNVYGEGVIVRVNDTDERDVSSWDLIYLVNELRYAGAEAIEINGQRVVNTTEIVDLGGFSYISVGGQRLEAPYIVKAIGNQDYLLSILRMKDSGFVDSYKNSGIDVKVEESKKVEISQYNGEMTYKYLEVEEEKK